MSTALDASHASAPSAAEPVHLALKLLEAIRQVKQDLAARQTELPSAQPAGDVVSAVGAEAQPSPEAGVTRAARPPAAPLAQTSVPSHPVSNMCVDAVSADALPAAEPSNLGLQLLQAISQGKQMLAAQQAELAAQQAELASAQPAAVGDLTTALGAVEHATTEEEVVAAMEAFFAVAATAFPVDTDPVAALATVFGVESVVAVTDVCADAVVELEAEARATGGPITEQAASRIARSMVHRLTLRAPRTMAHAQRARGALCVRVMRAPRARRAHRRVVRLSAVASAGDGPPPEGPPAAARARDRARDDGLHRIVAAVERAVDLREQTDVEEALADALKGGTELRGSREILREVEP